MQHLQQNLLNMTWMLTFVIIMFCFEHYDWLKHFVNHIELSKLRGPCKLHLTEMHKTLYIICVQFCFLVKET